MSADDVLAAIEAKREARSKQQQKLGAANNGHEIRVGAAQEGKGRKEREKNERDSAAFFELSEEEYDKLIKILRDCHEDTEMSRLHKSIELKKYDPLKLIFDFSDNVTKTRDDEWDINPLVRLHRAYNLLGQNSRQKVKRLLKMIQDEKNNEALVLFGEAYWNVIIHLCETLPPMEVVHKIIPWAISELEEDLHDLFSIIMSRQVKIHHRALSREEVNDLNDLIYDTLHIEIEDMCVGKNGATEYEGLPDQGNEEVATFFNITEKEYDTLTKYFREYPDILNFYKIILVYKYRAVDVITESTERINVGIPDFVNNQNLLDKLFRVFNLLGQKPSKKINHLLKLMLFWHDNETFILLSAEYWETFIQMLEKLPLKDAIYYLFSRVSWKLDSNLDDIFKLMKNRERNIQHQRPSREQVDEIRKVVYDVLSVKIEELRKSGVLVRDQFFCETCRLSPFIP